MKLKHTIILLLLPILSISQQSTRLQGTILSTLNQSPVQGATVRLLKNKTIVTSNGEGRFTFSTGVLPDTLIVSHISYKTTTLFITNQAPVTVMLEPSLSELSEVKVNTGYQEITKERQAGSFEKIDTRQINQQVSTDIISRLKGVSTLMFDNIPNRPPVTIRGLSSIFGPNDPLIVVDNFPYQGDIQNINPNDIESITILKDAAAASVWGTKAGNGVIVINTKKGRFAQPLTVELNAVTTITGEPSLSNLKTITSASFIDVEQFLFSKGYYTSLETNTTKPALTPVVELLIAKRDGKMAPAEADAAINALRVQDVRNQFSDYIYGTAVNNQYALSMRGGSKNMAYMLSAGLDNNTNNLAAGYHRRTLRAENIIKATDKLRFTGSIAFTTAKTTSGKPSYESFTKLYPYAIFKGDDGASLPLTRNYRLAYTDTAGDKKLLDWNYYPLEDYRHTQVTNTLQDVALNAGLQYTLVNGISLDVKYQYQKQQVITRALQDVQSFFTREIINRFSQVNRTTGTVTYAVPKGDILDQTLQELTSNAIRAQFNADRSFNKHKITAIAGAEVRESTNASNRSRLYGYSNDILVSSNVDYVNTYKTFVTGASAAIPSNNALTAKTDRFVSIYANAAYTYNGLYIFSASARKDASNLFGVNANRKWQPLWSVGTAWNMSKEKFWRSTAVPNLKARLTYGLSGNVDQSRSAVTTVFYAPVTAQYSNLPYAIINQFANPDLRWEKISTLNFGLDFSLKNEWLNGSFDAYLKKGTDLFGNAPIDYTVGVGAVSVTKNVADIKGTGFELRLNAQVVQNRSFKWSATLLSAYNNTVITKYYIASARASAFINRGVTITPLEGKPIYGIASYKWAGLDSAGNPQGFINGKPATDYATITGAKTLYTDLVFSGPALPPLQGSLSNTFEYKNFTLTANIAYRLGYYFRKSSIAYDALFASWTGHSDFEKRWQKPGDEAFTNVPSLVYPNKTGRDAFYSNSEILVAKADNIRLQYVNLSYDLDKKQFKWLPFQHVQLYVSTANLGILWRANKENLDPDYATLPPSKSLSIGIRPSF